MNIVRIATRQSQLALWQANFIADQLRQTHPGLQVELVGMTTKGDRWLNAPLSEVGGKGLFVKELEAAMLEDRADMAVHSAKDLPAQLPGPFTLALVGFRAPVNDTLVGTAQGLDGLALGAVVGSSSLRRKAQLLALRPDLDVRPIRGNVDTRLAKLDAGEYDATVLAQAGIERLGIKRSDLFTLPVDLSLPAPGQGALAIECLADSAVVELLQPLQQPQVAACIAAERGVSLGLGADCSLPIAALAQHDDAGVLNLQVLLSDARGERLLRADVKDDHPQQLAETAVARLYAQGASEVLQALRNDHSAE